jgi:hypothetical protein
MRRIDDPYWIYSWNDDEEAIDPESEFASVPTLDSLYTIAERHVEKKRTVMVGEGPVFYCIDSNHVRKAMRTLKEGDC